MGRISLYNLCWFLVTPALFGIRNAHLLLEIPLVYTSITFQTLYIKAEDGYYELPIDNGAEEV